MTKVASIDAFKADKEVEDNFIELLDRETNVEGNVEPLSTSLLDRMHAIKKAADEAKKS